MFQNLEKTPELNFEIFHYSSANIFKNGKSQTARVSISDFTKLTSMRYEVVQSPRMRQRSMR